jgi:hypothetical protein
MLAKRYDLISVEHDKEWIGISDSHYIHAEITENVISTEHNQLGWYNLSSIMDVINSKDIDVFIIDGPPGNIGRHGILSIIEELPTDAIFLIDDVHRDAELDIFNKLHRWHGGEAKTFTSLYDSGKERKWGVLQP